jgi:hypothetical protein
MSSAPFAPQIQAARWKDVTMPLRLEQSVQLPSSRRRGSKDALRLETIRVLFLTMFIGEHNSTIWSLLTQLRSYRVS